ncbi:MAG: 4-hydroxy-3-methylbut-2-enyl diphosphate reductase [Thermodesulfovibrionales bacterium]|nr:4-hydroxy-3-methylbut-2-enyl diphosphate reductase [Thermodesulfovibrionales bacterium]
MKIKKAEMAGFCFGVKRAIELAMKAAREGTGVYTLGPLIHNPQVIERLKHEGVRPCDISSLPSDIKTVIIRTHGVEKELNEYLNSLQINVIDATCPFVKKAQQYAKLLHEEGYQVLILGDAAHPEVVGIKSYAGPDALVISDPDKLVKLQKRVGIVVQTTQPLENLQRLLHRAIALCKELKVYNTICNSTSQRLTETAELAVNVDIMLVIGGRNSANTTQLARLCESKGVRTYHIETAEELKAEWFEGVNSVGITAGASTPDWIIEDIINKLERFKG